MKKILFSLILSFICGALCALEVSVKVTPSGILAGEFASLSITCDSQGDMKFDLPEIKGVTWFRNRISTSRSFSSVNGVTSVKVTRSIHFTVSEPGSYEIPPFKVTCGKESAETARLKFTVVAPGSSPGKADNVPAAAAVVWPETGKFYTGQWIPLEVILTIPDGMAVGNYSFPRLSGTENLIFHNYTPRQGKRLFGEIEQRRTVYKDVNATQVIFPAMVRAITGVVPDIKGSITIGIVRRDERRQSGYDGFFDGFFDRMSERIVPLTIEIAPAEKRPEIVALPPVPDGVNYLDIFSPAAVTANLSAASAVQGEAFDLVVNVTGGDISQLKAPELKLPGFRVYPGELRPTQYGTEIRYCLIPLKPGKAAVSCSFASFDPKEGKYRIFKVEKTLSVSPSNKAEAPETKSVTVSQSVDKKELDEAVKTPSLRSEPLYIKTGKRSFVHLALWKNSLIYYIAGLVVMPLAAVIIALLKRRRRNTSSGDIEREAAVKAACVVLKGRKAGELLSDSERRMINSGIGAALGLPAGASASEIAQRLSDPELSGWFSQIDAASFAAGMQDTAVPDDRIRRKLLKLLKNFVFLLALLPLMVAAQSGDALFDQGKYLEAAEKYRAMIDSSRPSPELLYNFGTASLRAGKLPAARAALLSAHKLAPRDSEITGNLNLVNRKLLQNEVNRTDTPAELLRYIRDRLRPDEHLAFGSLLFGLACIIYALNFKKSKAVTGVILALAALSLFCAVSQKYDSYDNEQAVTLPEYLQLMALPTDGKNSVIATLPGGSDARILQTRGDWVELEINGKNGWAKSDAVAVVIRRK